MDILIFWDDQRAAGLFLTAGILPLAIGVFLFLKRGGLQGAPIRHPTRLQWERGLLLVAVGMTAVGFSLLEGAPRQTAGGTFARTGSSTYFFAAVFLIVAESMSMRQEGGAYPLIVGHVLMALLAQAAVGVSLVLSGETPAWVGWAAMGWNVGWLVLLPLTTREDIYYPVLHHIVPLLIGLDLLLGA